ncbi:MAG: AmmeMemoRadiSam system protein B [Firmicutes bacterium]|nr:AmmeMemoRadiSam system protein B [Bacillota bacterium]
MRKLIILLLALLVLGGCGAEVDLPHNSGEGASAPSLSVSDSAAVVLPTAAPSPIDSSRFISDKLAAQAVAAAAPYDYSDQLKALVLPHHGTAAQLISSSLATVADAETTPPLIIIIGPNHANSGHAVTASTRGWLSCYGGVSVDAQLAEDLAAQGLLQIDEQQIENEHSIGVLAPFLAYYLPDVPVLPLIFHYGYDTARVAELFAALQPQLEAGALLIASIDFSHHLSVEQATERDAETEAALLELNSGRIAQMNSEYLDAPTLLAALLDLAADNGWQPVIGAHTSAAAIAGAQQMDDITTYFCVGFGPTE